jgi:hypothetical protein
MPREPYEVVAGDRRVLLDLDRVAEDRPPVRAARAEVGRRRERDVDLQPVGKQVDPVDRRPPREVPVVESPEVALQDLGPPRKRGRELAADSEGQIDV